MRRLKDSKIKAKEIIKEKKICAFCNKKLGKDWYKSGNKYFCSIQHADDFENIEVKNGN